jgi:hypothetical protein
MSPAPSNRLQAFTSPGVVAAGGNRVTGTDPCGRTQAGKSVQRQAIALNIGCPAIHDDLCAAFADLRTDMKRPAHTSGHPP